MQPDPAPERSPLRLGAWAFGLLGLAAVVALAAHLGEFEHFLRLLRGLAPAWLLLALLMQVATYGCVAASWGLGLREAHSGLPFATLLALALQKLFVDQTLPSGGVSGTAFLVAALRRRGLPAPSYLASLLADLVGHYAAYLVAALAAVALLRLAGALAPWMVGIATLFSLVSLAIPGAALALRGRGLHSPHSPLHRLPGVASLAEAFADAPTTLLRRPGLLATFTALNLAVMLLDAGTLWVMLRALGAPVAFQLACPAFLLATMVAMLAPVPMGLGTFEATCVGTLVLLGARIEAALTATLLLRGLTTWLPMLPGLLLTRRELKGGQAAGQGPERSRAPADRPL